MLIKRIKSATFYLLHVSLTFFLIFLSLWSDGVYRSQNALEFSLLGKTAVISGEIHLNGLAFFFFFNAKIRDKQHATNEDAIKMLCIV